MPLAQYVHIMKIAEKGLICDSLIAEKDKQIAISGDVIVRQKAQIEDKNDKIFKQKQWIKILGVGASIQAVLLVFMVLA